MIIYINAIILTCLIIIIIIIIYNLFNSFMIFQMEKYNLFGSIYFVLINNIISLPKCAYFILLITYIDLTRWYL